MSTSITTSPDGTLIAYDIDGSGPPLVLLHGGGHSRRHWHAAGYVERLRNDFRVVTMDIRGSGESGKPTDPARYTTDEHGRDILAVADACGFDRFALWGFSYGGNIGRYLAARSPRIASLVSMGIPFGLGASGDFREMILRLRAHWTPILQAEANGTLDTDALSADDRAGLERGTVPLALAWLGGILDWGVNEPKDLLCPTLWLVGSRNAGAIASVEAYGPALEGSKVCVEILPDLNHEQEFTEVDRVLPVMRAFTLSPLRGSDPPGSDGGLRIRTTR